MLDIYNIKYLIFSIKNFIKLHNHQSSMDKTCQSCGMQHKSRFMCTHEQVHVVPLKEETTEEYCEFCFKDGQFTFNGTYEEFVEKQVKIAMEKMDMPEDKAREMANKILPTLKRWKK